jgi:hypothetical protein
MEPYFKEYASFISLVLDEKTSEIVYDTSLNKLIKKFQYIREIISIHEICLFVAGALDE